MFYDSIWLWVCILFLYQFLTAKWDKGTLFRLKHDNHFCLNQVMEGSYECEYCDGEIR